ncbi:MAG: IS110 family transposase [Cyanobacteria bacterium P01_D01_bin.116]
MKNQVMIGIDVSKETLDFAVLSEGKKLFHVQVSNGKKGISEFCEKLRQQVDLDEDQWLFCLEHTGVYCNPVLEYASRNNLAIWMEDAKRIKAFHGVEREKTDKVDALKIAEYAYAKSHKAVLWVPNRPVINRLKALLKCRERLVDTKKRLSVALTEKEFDDPTWAKEHERLVRPVISKTAKQIKEIERKIEKLINQDDQLKKNYELTASVTGVGLIVASNMLVVSGEYKRISNPRKMACHCGVAPFKKQSGKSVKGRAKVSHQANKSMKTLLNLAARSAVNCEGELRDFYLRKVKEGKNKMAVLNAVRNKIIHRIFACIRDNRKYEKNYTHALA